MGEKNPLCPDQGGHYPHTVQVQVTQGQAVMLDGKGHTGYRLVELPDGRYVTDCDGYRSAPIRMWRPS